MLLRVRGIPTFGFGVRDPQAWLVDPLQPDNQVDGGSSPPGSGSWNAMRMARFVILNVTFG